MTFPIEKDCDYQDKVSKIANDIYSNGNSHRSEKNGNPKAFIETVMSDPNVCVVGLFQGLPNNFKAIIDDSDMRKSLKDQKTETDVIAMKGLINFLMYYANTQSKTHFCYISKKYLDAFQAFLNGEKDKNIIPALTMGKYFTTVERRKVSGGTNKKGSVYEFKQDKFDDDVSFMMSLRK